MRKTFTVGGKRIPPEIFRDFGDGDLADSGSIWVTVDVHAAVGSNLYADPIKDDGRWVTQTKLAEKTINGQEETSYQLIGATAFTWLQDMLPRHTEYWRSVFGAIILLLVLAFPMGIGGVAASWLERVRWR